MNTSPSDTPQNSNNQNNALPSFPKAAPQSFQPGVIITPDEVILPSLAFRAYALGTGDLVDVTPLAREAGFAIPVALTRALHKDIAAIPPAYSHEDETGRLWDVLNMARVAVQHSKGGGADLTYRMLLHVENRSQYQVRLSVGPGDEGEPVLTLSHPDKDKNVPLGEIHLTEGALEAFANANTSPGAFLARHKSGDWGEVDKHDQAANDKALQDGTRLVSAYTIPQTDTKIWIITEWNRSQTTVLLPSEY